MKKVLFLSTALICSFAALASAQMKGGFSGNTDNITITTVNQVENLPDETYVTMQGNITSQVGHEKYMFKDETGTLKIEIDDDDWNGLVVGPEDRIQIQGEVDKSWTKPTKIEVDSIQIIPSK